MFYKIYKILFQKCPRFIVSMFIVEAAPLDERNRVLLLVKIHTG